MPSRFGDELVSSPGVSRFGDAPAGAESDKPGAFSRFIDSVTSQLPTPSAIIGGIKEWWNRPEEIGKAMDALHVLNKAASLPENKGKPPAQWKSPPLTDAENEVVERGLHANLPGADNSQHPLLQPMQTSVSQAAQGDYAGAAGSLVGGYAAPVAVGAALESIPAYAGNLEGAAAYRVLLEQKAAQFGLDPEQVKAMKQPVLVRELSDDAVKNQGQAQAAVTDLNKTGTAALRPAERAIADSGRVSQGTLDDIAGRLEAHGPDATLANVLEGKSGAEVLNKMIEDGVISPQERAGLASGDSLTAEGKARISKLMLGRFFRDPAQLDRIPHAIVKKLERVAAPLAKVENSDWSLTPRVQEALDLIEEVKSHNAKNLDVFLKQGGLLGDQMYSPEAVEMAKTLQKTPTAKLTEMVRRYAEDAQFAAGGQSLFGNAPTPKQSFREAFDQ